MMAEVGCTYCVSGEWFCDDGFVYLRKSNTQGVADIKFFFGNPGDIP